jgi:hypothetical protein
MFQRMRAGWSASLRRGLAGILLACAATACAGVSFERSTETSGTFSSYGVAFTFLSTDFPKGAMLIARENASDANLANMEVDKSSVFPYFGPLDWVLDILGVRYARISGTWGFAGR